MIRRQFSGWNEKGLRISDCQLAIGNSMKIVRIIARLNVGGPAKHVVWLTAGLQNAECQSLLVTGSVPSGEEDMGYFAAEQNVNPVFLSEMSREVSTKDLRTIWNIYRLLRRERPDVVHTHTAKAGTVGRVAGLLYRWSTPGAIIGRPRQCRFVHTYHGHIFHSYYGPLKTRFFLLIEKSLARLITDRIVVVSNQQRHEIAETFRVGRKKQFVVIPLGIDTSTFANASERRHPFREELGVSENQVLVGIVGRLTEIKNHDMFLRAIALFRKTERERSESVKFVIIGDGQLRNKLQAQSRSLGLESSVVFAGNRPDPEFFYPALDIVALTSRNEGTPLTLLEAMASRRSIIATRVGGVVDLLGEAVSCNQNEGYLICERGIGVPANDTAAFAAGLTHLIADDGLRARLGERGLEFVKHGHSKERLLNDIKGLYGELLKPRANLMTASSRKSTLESQV
jgi:glycosyltransferase involved in cell wall biosynthesis